MVGKAYTMKLSIYILTSFFLLFSSFNAVSQGNIVKKYYENGVLKEEYPIVSKFDSTIHGNYKRYHQNGNLAASSKFINGAKQGPFKRYYPNGQEKIIVNHINDLKNGEIVIYNQQGKIIQKGVYETISLLVHFQNLITKELYNKKVNLNQVKINGLVKDYYENGSIKAETPFINDITHGVAKTYYKNGQVETEAKYYQGKLNGFHKTYYDNGVLELEITHEGGKKEWKI